MHRVTQNVYAEDRYIVATVGFLVTREGVVLMDTPMCPTDAREWRALAESHGPIRYVVNTEHHRDHIIGNTFFPGTVIGQAGTAERFMRSIVSPAAVRGFLERIDPQGIALISDYVPRPPTIVFDGHLVLHLGDHTLDLRHAPGHVPNGTWAYIPQERTVFTGDNIINGAPPFFHSAVPSGWLQTLDALAKLDVEHIVPGHGAPCGPEAIPRVKAAVTAIIAEVQRGWEAGWSREGGAGPHPLHRSLHLPRSDARALPSVGATGRRPHLRLAQRPNLRPSGFGVGLGFPQVRATGTASGMTHALSRSPQRCGAPGR